MSKYNITASHCYELLPSDGIPLNPAHFKMIFTEKLDALDASPVFENATFIRLT